MHELMIESEEVLVQSVNEFALTSEYALLTELHLDGYGATAATDVIASDLWAYALHWLVEGACLQTDDEGRQWLILAKGDVGVRLQPSGEELKLLRAKKDSNILEEIDEIIQDSGVGCDPTERARNILNAIEVFYDLVPRSLNVGPEEE